MRHTMLLIAMLGLLTTAAPPSFAGPQAGAASTSGKPSINLQARIKRLLMRLPAVRPKPGTASHAALHASIGKRRTSRIATRLRSLTRSDSDTRALIMVAGAQNGDASENGVVLREMNAEEGSLEKRLLVLTGHGAFAIVRPPFRSGRPYRAPGNFNPEELGVTYQAIRDDIRRVAKDLAEGRPLQYKKIESDYEYSL